MSPTATGAAINTAKVTDRRPLRFASLTEVHRDLDTLDEAHRAGTLRATGNWSAAQVFNHLAAFMEYPFNGYPPGLASPPAIVRFIVRFMKNKYIRGGMPVGVRIPRLEHGTVGQDDGPLDEALARLRTAARRLDSTAPSLPNPLFGPLSHEEWKGMNLRHCELHLSFLHPR